MTHIDLFSPLLDKLYDMIAVFCLDDTRHTVWIAEIERNLRELRHPVGPTVKTKFTALHRRAVLTIHDGECRERHLSSVHPVCIITQTGLDVLDLLLGYARIDHNYLSLDLHRHIRHAVRREGGKIFPHIIGRSLDIFGQA